MTTRRAGGSALALAQWSLYALAFLGLAATFAPLLTVDLWWIRVLSFPRMQILAALGLVLVLLIALPGRGRPLSLVAAAAALIGVAGQTAILWPYTPVHAPQARTQLLCAPEDRLRVAAINLQYKTERAEDLIAGLLRAEPDLIFFQEVDPWWARALAALKPDYPYTVMEAEETAYGVRLVSRYPLVDPEVRNLTSSNTPSIFTGVRLPSEQVVSFYGIHPRPPAMGRSTLERDGQILGAALAIAEDARPSVLAGDFNAPPWSPVVRQAARIARLLEPRIGRGWTPTYGAHSLVVTWPLDYILVSDDFAVGAFRTLQEWESDHLPIFAELCLEPEAPLRVAVEPPSPEDLAEARATLREAQNAATAEPLEQAPPRETPQ